MIKCQICGEGIIRLGIESKARRVFEKKLGKWTDKIQHKVYPGSSDIVGLKLMHFDCIEVNKC